MYLLCLCHNPCTELLILYQTQHDDTGFCRNILEHSFIMEANIGAGRQMLSNFRNQVKELFISWKKGTKGFSFDKTKRKSK